MNKTLSNTVEIDSSSFLIIFEQSPISTQIFAPDGTSLTANKAWENLWGVKHEQIKGYNVLKDKQLSDKKISSYIKKGFRGEIVLIPAIRYEPQKTISVKGAVQYRWVQGLIYPVKDKNNKILNVVLHHEDITEKKYSEEQLKESQAQLKATWESAGDAMALSDSEAIVIDANPAYFNLYGYSMQEVIGKNFAIIFPQDSRKMVNYIYKKTFVGKKSSAVVQSKIVAKDGSEKYVESRYSFLKENNKRTAMLSIVRDVTEQKKLEQNKDDFVSIATHELKTPVTSLKAYAEVLQKKFTKAGDLVSAGHLGKMNTQLDRLNSLIGDLLDATKIESGKLQMQIEKFDFDDLVLEIVEELQRITEKHKLIIKGKTNKKVTADRERMGQVLSNLISNAIKYSPHTDKIIIIVTTTNDEVKVCVQDFGVGIAKSKQPMIFQRFYRVSGPKKNTYPGLGLGLYISSEIIKRQGGKIWVESEKGKGSIFCFFLPLKVQLKQQRNSLSNEEMKHS